MLKQSSRHSPGGALSRSGSPRLLVIVPAYNEVGAVGNVVADLRTAAPRFDVLVIDDGSTDATAARAAAAGARVIRMPFNLGIGGAVQSGFLYAFEHGYDYVAQVDGDGQHDPAELERLLSSMLASPGVDIVSGSRFLPSEHQYPAPLSRRTGIRLFSLALTRMVGQPITDPTSGFRLFNRRAIALFARDYPHDYPEVEAVLMAHKNHLRITEVPVRMHLRTSGSSSITKRASLYYMVKVSLALMAGLLRRQPVVEPGGPAPVSTGR
jgi:glycosyltransferase involved in cell wall biosynthesis